MTDEGLLLEWTRTWADMERALGEFCSPGPGEQRERGGPPP